MAAVSPRGCPAEEKKVSQRGRGEVSKGECGGGEVRESSAAGSCGAFVGHGKEFGFYFKCHGKPLEGLHLRVTRASILLKAYSEYVWKTDFRRWDGKYRKSNWEVNQ